MVYLKIKPAFMITFATVFSPNASKHCFFLPFFPPEAYVSSFSATLTWVLAMTASRAACSHAIPFFSYSTHQCRHILLNIDTIAQNSLKYIVPNIASDFGLPKSCVFLSRLKVKDSGSRPERLICMQMQVRQWSQFPSRSTSTRYRQYGRLNWALRQMFC